MTLSDAARQVAMGCPEQWLGVVKMLDAAREMERSADLQEMATHPDYLPCALALDLRAGAERVRHLAKLLLRSIAADSGVFLAVYAELHAEYAAV